MFSGTLRKSGTTIATGISINVECRCALHAHNCNRVCSAPANFDFLTEQFLLTSTLDILKCSETFLDRYGMEDLKITMQLELVLSCTAEKFWLYVSFTKMMQTNDSCTQTPAIFGKQLFKQSHSKCYFEAVVKKQILANLFVSLTCLLHMYFALPCANCGTECTFGALHH